MAIAILAPACGEGPDDGDADTTSAPGTTLPGTTLPGTTDATPVSDSASSGATEACEQEMYVEQHCFDPGGLTTTLGPDEWGSGGDEGTTGGDASMCDGLDPPIPNDCAKVIVETGPAYVAAGMCCYDVEYMRGCCG